MLTADSPHQLLVVFTNSAGLEAAMAQQVLKLMALRPDQISIDEVLLIDQDTCQIGPTFYLESDKPFQAMRDSSVVNSPICYQAKVVGFDLTLGYEQIDQVLLTRLGACMTGKPRINSEAFTVQGNEFFDDRSGCWASWNEYLFSELLDQLILNRNDPTHTRALKFLRGPGGDSLSQAQEYDCLPYAPTTPPKMKVLPTNWRKVAPQYQHDALLRLLNSHLS